MGHYQAVTGEIRKDSTAADEKHGACWISWRKADYYFVYLLYNDHKVDEYDDYMRNKWGARE